MPFFPSPLVWLGLSSCLTWCSHSIALAQARVQPPTDRSSSAIANPVLQPGYANPRPSALAQPNLDTRPSPNASELLSTYAGVEVLDDGNGKAAVPHGQWRPPSDPVGALALDYSRGTALDGAWVRRQFEKNDLIAGSYSRALALVQLINRAYLTAGFLNSGVIVAPSSGDDALNLELILGRLAGADGSDVDVTWQGPSKGLSVNYLRERLPSAREIPLDANAVEREFRLLADDPAIKTVNVSLAPGSKPGEAVLNLFVQPQDRSDFWLAAANNRSPSVGGERIFFGGSLRNLLTSGDLVIGEYGQTDGLEDLAVTYTMPLWRRFGLTAQVSTNDAAVIDRPLVPLDITSRERSVEAGLTYDLIKDPLLPRAGAKGWSPARTISIGLSVGHSRSKSFLLGEPFSFSPGSVNGKAEYTALRLSGDFLSRSVNQVFSASIRGTLGLDGTRSELPGVPSPNSHFRILTAYLSYAREIREGLEIRGRVTGQITSGTIYSAERLAAGGASTVRGYRENLVLADRGVVGSLEIAVPLSDQDDRNAWQPSSVTISAFVDGALVSNSVRPQPTPRSLLSVGPSVSWAPHDSLSVLLSYGIPLRRYETPGEPDLQDDGFHFSVAVRPLNLFGKNHFRRMR